MEQDKDMDQLSLPEKKPVKWYFKPALLVTAFLCVGPLALPLLWLNPGITRTKKILISVLVIFISVYTWTILSNSLKTISEYYNLLNEMSKS